MGTSKKDQFDSENSKVSKLSKKTKLISSGIINYTIEDGNISPEQLSEAIHFSEKWFRILYYQSPVAIEHYDKTGHLIDVNPSCLSLFGVATLDDIINFNLFADPNISSDNKKKLRRNETVQYQGIFDFGKVRKLRLYPTRKKGTIWIDVIITPLKNQEILDGYLVQINDITDRKLAVEAIRKSEEKYRNLFENVQDVFYKIDLNGKIIEISPSIKYFSEFDRDELIGHSVLKLYANSKDRRPFLNFLLENRDVRDYEIKMKSKTGKIIYASINASLLLNKKGKPNYITGAIRDISKRKMAEAMFHDVIEKNPMSIQIVDKDGYTVKVNPAHTMLFGALPPSDYSIFNDTQLKQSGYHELFRKLKKGEMVHFPDAYYNIHDSVTTMPDKPMYLRVFGFPINYGVNKPQQFVLLHENITKRKLAQDALRKNEELFRSVVQNIADLITLTDEKGILRYVSPQCEKVLGFPTSKFIGVIMPDIIHPEDKLRCQLEWEKVFYVGDELHDVIYRIIDSKKKVRWISQSSKLLKDNGINLGILSTLRNITESKLTEIVIRESEEKYRLLFDNSSQAIVVAQGNFFRFVNPKVCEILGYSEEELLSIAIPDFIYPKDRKMVIGNYRKRLNGESSPQNYQFRFLRKDKTIAWVELNAVLITWLGKTASLNFMSDITKRKQAEEELHNSNEQLHQLTKYMEEVREEERLALARDLHDELGQALTAVNIDLVMIKKKITNNEIALKIEKISALVNNTIKSVQRITSNLRPEIINDLGLDEAIELYAQEFSERSGIEVFLIIDPEIVFHYKTALNIYRIVQESLTNISRHAKATKVVIKLKKTFDSVCIKISDNGIGINEDFIKSKQSFGIMSMKERATSLGGTFEIYHGIKNGTEIKLILPLQNL
jgi:PAS domain S-box-containing protein